MRSIVAGEGGVGASISEPATNATPADFASWVSPHITAMTRLAGRLARPADRDDIVQEALVRAWQRRHTYDPSRGEVLPWLLAIVADRARRIRVRRLPDDVHDLGAAANSVGARSPAQPDRDLDLERALHALPKRERLAVALYYFIGLDITETAAAMGVSAGTVKATLHHARSRLRNHLGGEW
jgi:RNA polymerase sigma-70 factor (ECF subfamily)